MVRIHLPPAVSRQTIGSLAAEPDLPFAQIGKREGDDGRPRL